MAEMNSAKTGARKSAKRATDKASKGFTAEERTAMKARVQEMKAEVRANKSKAEGESEVLAAIAKMQPASRSMAQRLHALIRASAPGSR